jgi:hypothetical protein
LVIGVGEARPVAQLAAGLLGRGFAKVPDLASAEKVDVPPGGSVLLAALAEQCSLAQLAPLLTSWSARSIRVGLLTGLDVPGLAFSLAKLLAARTCAPHQTQDAYFDGVTGTARTGTDLQDRVALEKAVASQWSTVVLEAHGSGSHALLGPYSVCGLTSEHEHHTDGQPVPGGCTEQACRSGNTLSPLLLRDLACRNLTLFVCNAITLDVHEQYPSSVALSHAALEGHPAATIGMLRQDLTITTEPHITARLIADGHPLGAVAAHLTDAAAQAGRPYSYLLLGDPEATAAAVRTSSTGDPAVLTPWPGRRLPSLPHWQGQDGAGPLEGLVSRDGLWHEPAGTVVISDGERTAQAHLGELTSWLDALDAGALFEDNLRAAVMSTDRPKTPVVEGLKVMRRHREAARQSVLTAMRKILDIRRAGHGSVPDLPDVSEHSTAWARALAEMSAGSRTGMLDRVSGTAIATHTLTHGPAPAGDCTYCRSPLERTTWTGPLARAAGRIRITCPRCGLLADRPDTAWHAQTNIEAPPELVPGAVAAVRVRLPSAAPGMWLTVQLRHRSRMHALAVHHDPDPAVVQVVELAVPTGLQPEVHRVWALIVDRFQPALHQLRTPSTPARTDLAGTSPKGATA